jgi:hypothetical protein
MESFGRALALTACVAVGAFIALKVNAILNRRRLEKIGSATPPMGA